MIKKKILFITGAGSSADFGLPSGQGLIKQILKEQWETLDNEKVGINIDKDDFNKYQSKIRFSKTPSIDIFIANNPDYAELSKSLIAKIIGKLERQAIVKMLKENWIQYIWHKMVEGCRSFDEFKENKASFLTFNYDRILEVFFLNSIANFFNLIPEQKFYNNIIEAVPITHVFGRIGNLHIENPHLYRDLGDSLGRYRSWKDVGHELKTIYETEQSELYSTIKETINEADEIYFIGFGYNSFNLDFLGLKNWPEEKYISGSRYNMSEAEIMDINALNNNKFINLISKNSEDKCYEFLKNDVQFFAPGKKII